MKVDIVKFKEFKNQIFELRENAWGGLNQAYPKNKVVHDHLDKSESSIHWGIVDNGRLIAASRISILSSLEELPYSEFFEGISLPEFDNFAFYSRLVIHPDYRGLGYARALDAIRMKEIKKRNINLVIATARDWRLDYLQKEGWSVLKQIDQKFIDQYKLGQTSIIMRTHA